MVVGFVGLPAFFVFRIWQRYLSMPPAERESTRLGKFALCSVTFTSVFWIFFYLLAVTSDYTSIGKSLLSSFTPYSLAVPNMLLSAVTFAASIFVPRPIRNTLLLASAWMLVVWLFASLAH